MGVYRVAHWSFTPFVKIRCRTTRIVHGWARTLVVLHAPLSREIAKLFWRRSFGRLRVGICFEESKGLHVNLPRVRFTMVIFILSGIYLTTYLAYSVLVQLHKIPATKCPPLHTTL